MPCNTITRVKLELKNANPNLLGKAVKAVLGNSTEVTIDGNNVYWYGGSYNRNQGTLTVRNESVGKEIKKSYSAEIVKQQATRFGWKLKQTGAYQFEIEKR